MTNSFNGLGLNLGNLSRLSNAESRSCSAENPTGAKGQGGRHIDPGHVPSRELGQGWKVRPSVAIQPGETLTLADMDGPGAIQQIWMTPTGNYRFTILRFYWDGEATPSVEVPVGDFFASAYTSFNTYRPLNSLAVCVNPGNAFNCYWEMPFRRHCRITLENIGPEEMWIYYQVNYTLTEVPADAAYFHAQFRRVNPLPSKDVHTLLDGVRGQGHYVGTYMAWQVNNNGWWGEGEIKFYLDGDLPGGVVGRNVREHGGDCYPTICGTGTEDYFCGSYNFENKATKQYQEFSTAYAGLPHIVRPDGAYQANTRFSLYRWHIMDPVRFRQDLAVTMQALSWRAGRSYLPNQDDIASTAFWYQTEPHADFPSLLGRNDLEII
ncbi:MAG: glycoside hydrolase family 172 protein [Thermoflexales bacterium]